MKTIATLTMNPTIDIAYEVDRVEHTHKIRTRTEHYCPGGGGINVARVFVRLGGNARCYYLSGGATGPALDGLIDLHQLVRCRVAIAGHTRVANNILERSSGKEYRFVPAGPTVSEAECEACLDMLAEAPCGMLVASGSLPPGVPTDFYARVAAQMRRRNIAVVLDSSGEALAQGIAGGGILLAKPSLGEMRQLCGRPLDTPEEIAAAASEIVHSGKVEMLAVTLGHRGALLATARGTLHLPAIEIDAKSAVGAGDSFLAGMVFKLAGGAGAEEAFRYGMAAGAAAVLTPGTNLAYPEDIDRLYAQVGRQAQSGRFTPLP